MEIWPHLSLIRRFYFHHGFGIFWLGIFRGMRSSNVNLECRHWFCDLDEGCNFWVSYPNFWEFTNIFGPTAIYWNVFTKGFTFIYYLYGSYILNLRIYGGFMSDLWRIYDWFMKDLWRIYGRFMGDLGNSFVNTKVPRKFTLCTRFQLGNSFVNTTVPRKFTLCIRFQLGSSFVNTKVPRKFTLCIRFQLGNSFVNTTVPRKFSLCIRFQLGSSFVNTKVPKKFTLCIRFQLGNAFGNAKVPRKFTSCIRFQLSICEYLEILSRQFSISFRCLFLESNKNAKCVQNAGKTWKITSVVGENHKIDAGILSLHC